MIDAPAFAPDAIVPPAVQQGLDSAAARVPAGKRGGAWATVTTSGVQGTVGMRRGNVTASGYAGKVWGGGYAAGAQVGVSW